MANYKDIKGTTVQVKSATQPTTYPQLAGELYYNSSNGDYEFLSPGAGVWSSGGALNAARSGRAAAGTQTTGIAFGGWNPTSSVHASTEKYDGSSWTEVNDLNTGRASLAGASNGSQTASLAFGGSVPGGSPAYQVISEEYDGTNWAEGNDLNGTKAYGAGSGTQTAALAIATAGPPIAGIVEAYDGTSWSEVNDLNTGRDFNVACGTQTASLTFQGESTPGPNTVNVELYDGTSWSEVGNINTARNAGGGAGISTTAITFGGSGLSAATESYDGTSWTEVADLATARMRVAGAGSTAGSTAALNIGGQVPIIANVEEWAFSHSLKTVTTS